MMHPNADEYFEMASNGQRPDDFDQWGLAVNDGLGAADTSNFDMLYNIFKTGK
jgi:hypothetical protein